MENLEAAAEDLLHQFEAMLLAAGDPATVRTLAELADNLAVRLDAALRQVAIRETPRRHGQG